MPWRPVASALLVMVVAAPGCERRGAAVRVFVSNEDSGDVTVIDAERDEVVATIAVGKRPRGIRAAPDGRLVYVAVSGSPKGGPSAKPPGEGDARDESADGIVVVDVAERRVVRVLAAGQDPEAFDVSADGKTLYVSNEETAELAIVDVASGRVSRTVKVGREPEGVAVTRDGRFVYVTSEGASEVDVVDTKTDAVIARIPTATRPRAVVFDPSGQRAFVTAELGGTVHVIDAHAHALVGAPVRAGREGVKPMGVVVSPDGARAYVTNGREGSVSVVDVGSQRVERSIDAVGARPWGIGITPDGRKLYVASSRDVAVIDPVRGVVTKRIAGGSGSWGVAVARGGGP